MVDIPAVIISKPRKFAHDAFTLFAAVAFFIASAKLLAGHIGAAIFFAIVMAVLANIASKIKFKWVLRRGVVEYV